MPVALSPRPIAPATPEEAFYECWHVCPKCLKDHMHKVDFQGAKLDSYYKVCPGGCKK